MKVSWELEKELTKEAVSKLHVGDTINVYKDNVPHHAIVEGIDGLVLKVEGAWQNSYVFDWSVVEEEVHA